jgi:hypothetical protein
MTKVIYNYKRCIIHVPVGLRKTLDLRVDYDNRFCDPYVIMVPKDLRSCEYTILDIAASMERAGQSNPL